MTQPSRKQPIPVSGPASGRASGPASLVASAALALALGAGCGDGPLCSERILVGFADLVDGQLVLGAAGAAVERDIRVHSGSLREGDAYQLSVTDAAGGVATFSAVAGPDGGAVIEGVTLPAGAVTLSLVGASGDCGAGTAQITVNVGGDDACGLSVREPLIQTDHHGPLGVLNAAADSDPAAADFQANIDIATRPGLAVTLFVVDVDAGAETALGPVAADAAGAAAFAVTLGQGRQVLRATCASADGAITASTGSAVALVDTIPPACALDSPPPGGFIIPDQDIDPATPGTQIALVGAVTAGPGDDAAADVAGEPVVFRVGGDPIAGTPVDAGGRSTAVATFDAPGRYTIELAAADHAGNACAVSRDHDYVEDGCAFDITTDLDQTFTADANADPADGFQVAIAVDVDPACAGDAVLTDCGEGLEVPIGAGGQTALSVTLCATASCEATDACAITTRSAAGITVTQDVTVRADNVAPAVALQLIDPPLVCGGALTPADDVDPAAPGVQLDARVVAAQIALGGVEVTDSEASTASFPAALPGGDTRVTVEPGASDVRAFAEDAAGNRATTGACAVTLADIAINFAPPIDDGLVGRGDGAVGPGGLTLDLCGTASEPGLQVTVAVDGGPPQPAQVAGTAWCLPATLAESPPAHAIDVTATDGVRVGLGSLALTVDLTAPVPIAGLAADAPTRQSVRLAWTAPDDGGVPAASYAVKVATVALTDANFDTAGADVPAPAPAAPGTPQTLVVETLRPGTAYFAAIAAIDAAGNRGPVAALGPIVPDFDASGAIGSPDAVPGDDGLGYQIARGDFNGDGLSDLAVGAPFRDVGALAGAGTVYVYLGTAAGLPAAPDIAIEGTTAGGQLGQGLAALDWGGDAADDLAVGAPFADGLDGRVYIFTDVDASTAATDADADVEIGSNGGWFSFGLMGYALAAADFDGDGSDDLVISVPGANGFVGGLAVLFGGIPDAVVLLSDLDRSGSGGARALALEDPDASDADVCGQAVFNLGRTEGPGDDTDDVGVAYFGSGPAHPNRAYVFRGRPQPVAPGVTVAALDLAADLVIADATTDPTTKLGNAMGSIADMNGDGARDIVIGAWQHGANSGRVFVVDGDAVGTQTIPASGFNAFLITRILPGAGTSRLGTAIANNAGAGVAPDIDADGSEDLVITGRFSPGFPGPPHQTRMFVWFGGSIPVGAVTTDAAQHSVTGPGVFASEASSSVGSPIVAIWAGDVNGDGLEDICWADSVADGERGAFELLSDNP